MPFHGRSAEGMPGNISNMSQVTLSLSCACDNNIGRGIFLSEWARMWAASIEIQLEIQVKNPATTSLHA